MPLCAAPVPSPGGCRAGFAALSCAGEEKMKRTLVLALLWGLALSACSLGKLNPKYWIPSERKGKVIEAAEAYGNSLRWGRLEDAARWVHPEQRREFFDTVNDPGAPLRFTLFEMQTTELGPARDRAEVWVSFSLYRPPALKEFNLVERQVWRYEPRTGRWYVDPDLALYRGEVASDR